VLPVSTGLNQMATYDICVASHNRTRAQSMTDPRNLPHLITAVKTTAPPEA